MSQKTKYFIDTEFIEDGKTIDLLSIGICCEDGRELYAVNDEVDRTKANQFVRENVLPNIYNVSQISAETLYLPNVSRSTIARSVSHFIGTDIAGTPPSPKPEFWGYYADYDWVVFCQLFGRLVDLPKGCPMYCNDIKQLCESVGNPPLPAQGKGEHHALMDARWNKKTFGFLLREAIRQSVVIS